MLGPVEVVVGDREFAPKPRKVHQLLAMLLLRAGRIVPIETLAEELWPEEKPKRARATAQTYVYQLRRMFKEWGVATGGEEVLVTRQSGYVLRIDPEQVDLFVFQRIVQQSRDLLRRHEHDAAAKLLRSALGMWTGSPLSDVACGPTLAAEAIALQEQRRNAQHLWIEAEIEVGGHHELISELRLLIVANPLDETLHGQLMRVLGRSGRRSDALDAFHDLRKDLNDRLGIEPGAELRKLYHELLIADREQQR
ncbi:AfsR/SARP family transcriptional regulator [Saccharopolyspora indica]|uniref:AfsR/SARP family transcriptional regulator n=1 Tax=Saccharopolyspora indica TaxID=1229659 RepID=UPI0022EB9E37|nr:AfsR/SARP family transcriptional regulator [Saccharopolyspora indica]MDA3645748.1 AfsR/SARP family transcriptional regulator [Saccharopolyspora indica]